jgi:hypothetical protein
MRSYRCHLQPQSAMNDSYRDVSDRRSRSDPSEIIGVPRCPCCRAPLIARMGRRGPYFYCRCVKVD